MSVSGKTNIVDHFPPELIDHLWPVVNHCYDASCVFLENTGQTWSRPPAFAGAPQSIDFVSKQN